MARTLIGAITHQISGEELTLTFQAVFYGADVPGGADSTICTVTLGAATTKAAARTAIRNAISVEATRLGYSYAGVATLIEELFVGL